MDFLESLGETDRPLWGITSDFLDATEYNLGPLRKSGLKHVRLIWYYGRESQDKKIRSMKRLGLSTFLPI